MQAEMPCIVAVDALSCNYDDANYELTRRQEHPVQVASDVNR